MNTPSTQRSIMIYGEALAFYSIHNAAHTMQSYAVFKPLTGINHPLDLVRGTWSDRIECVEVKDIVDIVGIWEGVTTKQTYILRKHPAISFLQPIELGVDIESSTGSLADE